MTPAPHPMQETLDRVRLAIFTAIDLYEILDTRPNDERSASLRRAIITAAVGGIEELYESAPVSYAMAAGLPDTARTVLSEFMAGKVQSTDPRNFTAALGFVAAPDVTENWQADLSVPKFKPTKFERKGAEVGVQCKFNTEECDSRTCNGKNLNQIVRFFTRARNSFAHQDSTRSIAPGDDSNPLRKAAIDLATGAASNDATIRAVERILTCAYVEMPCGNSGPANAISRWTIHGIHAQNSIRLLVGLTVSTIHLLASDLDARGLARFADYAPLQLLIEDGAWRNRIRQGDSFSPGKDFSNEIVQVITGPYAPRRRNIYGFASGSGNTTSPAPQTAS